MLVQNEHKYNLFAWQLVQKNTDEKKGRERDLHTHTHTHIQSPRPLIIWTRKHVNIEIRTCVCVGVGVCVCGCEVWTNDFIDLKNHSWPQLMKKWEKPKTWFHQIVFLLQNCSKSDYKLDDTAGILDWQRVCVCVCRRRWRKCESRTDKKMRCYDWKRVGTNKMTITSRHSNHQTTTTSRRRIKLVEYTWPMNKRLFGEIFGYILGNAIKSAIPKLIFVLYEWKKIN